MAQGKFVTVVNCMDGRTQLPVNNYLRKKFKADFVDTITEPGPVKILAEGTEESTSKSIRKRVEISVEKHGSEVIAVVAHADCAGNPVDRGVQEDQMIKALERGRAWGFKARVLGLWVDEDWQVSELKTE